MCVEMIIFLFGSMILIGYVVSRIFTAMDPLRRRCPVVQESEKAHSIAFFKLSVLKMVFAIGSSCRLLACTMCCHNVVHVVACRGRGEIWSSFAMVPRVPLL